MEGVSPERSRPRHGRQLADIEILSVGDYNGSMKTTVDILDKELKELIRHTGARTKRDAIVTAISDFNRRKRLEKLVEQFGTFDSVISLEELMRLREMG